MNSTAAIVIAAMNEQGGVGVSNSAFEKLIVKYQDMVYGYAYSILRDPFSANDAVQETFLKALLNLRSLRNPKAFPGWLKTIARRVCMRLSTEYSSRRGVEYDDDYHESHYVERPAVLDDEQTGREIRRAVAGLPDDHRAAVILYYFNGYSQKEIAGFLEISVAAVKKRLQRSRDTMREEMKRMIHENMEMARPSRDDGVLRRINLTTSFDLAAKLGQLTLLEQMMVDGIDVNEKDAQGRTLLHWAAHSGHIDMVRLLLRNGADPSRRDRDGLTPGQLAAVAGFGEISRLLKNASVDGSGVDGHEIDGAGR